MNFRKIKNEKAQTSLEVLLIVGGAVAIATIVGIYLKTQASKELGSQISNQQAEVESQLIK